ncbi:cobalamin-dependent protein [Myxococcota bacterium]|nr:cobalamin-dependent protein [Myxococcota bacterium]MBU1431330.1 cobalamin-dependent protein [Myxococcota bacterium]MBU1900266.1 cobalamin-dependent protein [Myxococcota bacterium]
MNDLLLVSTPLAGDALPGGVCPSLSNITLGSYIRAHGGRVSVLDPSVDLPEGDVDLLDAVVSAIRAEAPKVIGLSTMSTVEGRFALALARRLRRRHINTPIVVGGVWASGWGAEVLERSPEIDAVIAGPGEVSALSLAMSGLDTSIPGLIWREGGRILENPRPTTVAPPVALEPSLLRNPGRYDIFCWITSRGCPFSCNFCTECLTSPGFSTFPRAQLEADIALFSDVGADWYLWICDPLFGVNRAHLAGVCEALAEAPNHFLVESRVDVLHPDDVPKLAAAGCTLIYFGLEAVSARALLELNKIQPKGHARYLQGARALTEACLKHDILPVFGLVQPVPGDTQADLDEALAFVRELKGIAEGLGAAARGLAPCFHAFPLRFDRGAPYDDEIARLLELGVSFTEGDAFLQDQHLRAASPTIGFVEAEAFRQAIRALNPTSPQVLKRLYSSYPRPFVDFG